MSNFLKKGKRFAKLAEKKEIKKRSKEIYKILADMDKVALAIHENEQDTEFTHDNIEELASKYTSRKIGKLEGNILLSKLYNLKNTGHNED